MKAGHAHITVVVDRSGSMGSIRDDAEGGLNAFVQKHKEAPGTCSFLLEEFDDKHRTVFGPGNIQDAPVYKLEPRGMTALLDAVGRAIAKTGSYLDKLPESERPEKVIFVVQTDGGENASKEYSWMKVHDMVAHQTDVYKWEFLFLGADLAQAKGMGFSNTYGTANTGAAYTGTYTLAASTTLASRSAGTTTFNYGTVTIAPDGSVTNDDDDGPDGGVAAVVKAPKP